MHNLITVVNTHEIFSGPTSYYNIHHPSFYVINTKETAWRKLKNQFTPLVWVSKFLSKLAHQLNLNIFFYYFLLESHLINIDFFGENL